MYELVDSDFVSVKCWTDEWSDRKYWNGLLTGIRKNSINLNPSAKHAIDDDSPLNVIMFGLDSMSRNAFMRKLPRTYQYLTEVLHADVLKGYNIVGDGTPQAIIPVCKLRDSHRSHTKLSNSFPFDSFWLVSLSSNCPKLANEWKTQQRWTFIRLYSMSTPAMGTRPLSMKTYRTLERFRIVCKAFGPSRRTITCDHFTLPSIANRIATNDCALAMCRDTMLCSITPQK